jgi:putative ABC transport system permease protein
MIPCVRGLFAILTMALIFTLASRNLFHDRVRFIATIVGIVFSIVLVAVQLGLFLGFERMITTMIDHAEADLWIVPAETKNFEATSLLDGRERFQALAIDGVAAAIPVTIGFALWRKADGSAAPVFVVGVEPGGLEPWNLAEGSLEDLSAPGAVAVDRSYFERLGVTRIGDTAEIRDQKARVAVVTRGIRSFTTTPYVFTTIDRARNYTAAPSNKATFFIVRTRPGARVARIRGEIAARLSEAEVLTSDEFRRRSRYFWLFGTGAGAALFASAVLGLIVGTVIVAQTLYSSTKDHLNEFATLRAIGSSRAYIYRVILWQAFLSAVVGFSIAAGIALALVEATQNAALPIVINPGLLAGLFALTLAMCAFSAISAILVVTRLDPAMVFTR